VCFLRSIRASRSQPIEGVFLADKMRQSCIYQKLIIATDPAR
jgi:hypothetical protein